MEEEGLKSLPGFPRSWLEGCTFLVTELQANPTLGRGASQLVFNSFLNRLPGPMSLNQNPALCVTLLVPCTPRARAPSHLCLPLGTSPSTPAIQPAPPLVFVFYIESRKMFALLLKVAMSYSFSQFIFLYECHGSRESPKHELQVPSWLEAPVLLKPFSVSLEYYHFQP